MIDDNIYKKVLSVGPHYVNHRGGIGGVLENYSKYFSKFNFIPTYPPSKTKYKISSFPFFVGAIYKIFRFLLKNKEIEIVHIHGAARGSLIRKVVILFITKFLFRKKVIFHSHGGALEAFYYKSPKVLKYIISFLFNNVDLIICLSSQWKLFFETNFSNNNVIVLGNMVERRKGELVRCPNDKLVLLFLGIICTPKGIYDLIDVIIENKNEFEGKLILKIGGKGEVDNLKALLEKNGLEKIIFFKGWVTGKEKEELLFESDVYVLPSYTEALPLSILEAMEYSKPIVATNVGGIPEIVKDGENGFLIEPGDKKSMLKGILSFMSNPQRIREMGDKSRKMVEPYYAENIMEKLKKIYQGLS
jgi:glycosyltransferase involved in cell wall biosynthesis